MRKNLLAACMRLIEVGTKYQADNKQKEAKEAFGQAYKIYSLFWAIRLKLIDLSKVKKSDVKDSWSIGVIQNFWKKASKDILLGSTLAAIFLGQDWAVAKRVDMCYL